MTTTKFNQIQANPKHVKIAVFLLGLLTAGVPLDSVYIGNLEKKGVTKELVIIPKGKEDKAGEWMRTTFFTKQMADKAVKLTT